MEGSGLSGPQGGGDLDFWPPGWEGLEPWTFIVREPGHLGHRRDTAWGREARVFTCPHSAGPIQLWQFLLELLRDGQRSNCIRWTGNSREFQLCDPREVGELPSAPPSRPSLPGLDVAGPAPSSHPRGPAGSHAHPLASGTAPEPPPSPARPLPRPAPSCPLGLIRPLS